MSDPRVDTSAAVADGLQPLATVDPAAYALQLPAGLDHAGAYCHLTALLADSAGAEAAGLFAVPRPAGSRLEFRVPAGRVARFDELDATGRAALRAELGRLISLLRRSAEAKAARDPSRFAPLPALLGAAIEIPSFEYVYAREGRPVLAAWGLSPHARDGAGVVGGLGLLRVLDDGVPVERPARISARTLMIAALGLVVVGGGALLAASYLAQAFDPPAPVCTVVPAEREAMIGLDDERRRERDLRASLAALEQQLGAKRANCPIRVLPPPPPPITPQVVPQPAPTPPPVATRKPPLPPPPPPPLPADRWAQKDLSMLQSCWRLGRDTRTHFRTNGRTEMCDVRAGRICFGTNGGGQRSETMVCPSVGTITCAAPITARFGNDNTLGTTQPAVRCSPPTAQWHGSPLTSLTCRRIDDTLALCRDGTAVEYEFRRE